MEIGNILTVIVIGILLYGILNLSERFTWAHAQTFSPEYVCDNGLSSKCLQDQVHNQGKQCKGYKEVCCSDQECCSRRCKVVLPGDMYGHCRSIKGED